MRGHVLPWLLAGAALVGSATRASGQDDPHAHHHHQPSPPAAALDPRTVAAQEPAPAQFPYAIPRETLIPGTPGMPGAFHLMINSYGYLHNPGLDGYVITNPDVAEGIEGGATRPMLQHDWVMGYGRDARGRVEGLVMLDLEPLTVGPAGIPELGQSGEGLWDAQHSHYLFHQVMVAVHPLAWTAAGEAHMGAEPLWDLALFGGQGSATIGAPIFMHRASSPGPTVPRKHHKGENPHETFPVIGASLRRAQTTVEASVFSAGHLGPQDSRFYPHPGAPDSFAARVRHVFARAVEVQISGERLHGHDEPSAWQASASAYAWGVLRDLRVDALLDWGMDRPDNGPAAHGLLAELAVRSPDRRGITWLRTELNQRFEPPGAPVVVSSPWLFQTLGFEHVAWVSRPSGLQLGLFAEATYGHIPSELSANYGRSQAVSLSAGLHLFGMWMLDGSLRRINHSH
jgi:hypothetical protein